MEDVTASDPVVGLESVGVPIIAPLAVPSAEPQQRPASRRPTNFSLDLDLPMPIFFPEDDNKITVRFV